MAKYSFEFKLKMVQKYLNGEEEYSYLAKTYRIKDKSQIRRWFNAYKEFGKEGLFRMRQNKKYSVQFKLDAIALYQMSEMSYREVSNALGISNFPLITSWVRKFRENGVEGLSKLKGRPSNMTKKNKEIEKITPKRIRTH